MANFIQIAPLKKDFQRIIDFDRMNPASKIIVFVSKCDTEKGTPNYTFIEKSLNKLREYCQLAKIQFNMQVVDIVSKKNLLDVIFDFARVLILDFQTEYTYMLNLGDSSLLMNIALIQAAQLIKQLYTVNFELFLTEECKNEQHLFKINLFKSLDSLISEPVNHALLKSVDDGKNLDQIKDILGISLGTVSNYLKQLKDLDLIEIKGHNRNLTELGALIMKIFELKEANK